MGPGGTSLSIAHCYLSPGQCQGNDRQRVKDDPVPQIAPALKEVELAQQHQYQCGCQKQQGNYTPTLHHMPLSSP
jgi:hypothetical protein